MGNTRSIESILQHLGADVCITNNHEKIKSSNYLILPGVGSFNKAMRNLNELNLVTLISQQISINKPILGICLGMQLLAKSSTEGGISQGLGHIRCTLDKFSSTSAPLEGGGIKIPHVGYNSINIVPKSRLLSGLDANSDFYFTHSYRMQCIDQSIISSHCNNGETFVSSIEDGNTFGTQFHPELSQNNGLKLLSNFIKIK